MKPPLSNPYYSTYKCHKQYNIQSSGNSHYHSITRRILLSTSHYDLPRQTAPSRSPRLIYVTRLPRKVTLATYRTPLSLAMTDHGLRATAHVGPLYLRLANPGRTGIARSLHMYGINIGISPKYMCCLVTSFRNRLHFIW